MITHMVGDTAFVYRVAGVITDGKRVLLHRADCDNFWSLPGGQVEFLETSGHAIRRKLREEVGEEVTIDRLLWIVENFFEDGGTSFHEIGMYFLAHLPPDSALLCSNGPFLGQEAFSKITSPANEEPIQLVFQWFPLNLTGLDKEVIYPIFLRQSLVDLPDEIKHVVNNENESA